MSKNRIDDSTLSDILQDNEGFIESASRNSFEESKIRQSLLERPRFSIKARLTLLLFILFLVSAGVLASAMFMLSTINYRVQYIFLADRIANEVQHARRIEKNFFLYNTDLSEVKEHIANANDLLEQASRELGYVTGQEEIFNIRNDLSKYDQMANVLIAHGHDSAYIQSEDFTETAQEFRNYGSRILELSLDISRKERQLVSSTISQAKIILIGLLVVLLILLSFIIWNMTRHIISRLNRLMEATQRFASGDFTPITPKRKYKDEFSILAIAFNHMVYELETRQNLLLESHKLRAIGNLTAGIAHELNNPLNNIILTAEMLREDFKELPDEERLDMLNDLSVQGERARQIVKNLLDFARESETSAEHFYIGELIEKALRLVKNQIKLSKVKLETDLGRNSAPIYGDRKLLTQVLLNLFINAVDAMPEGGTLTVDVVEEKQIGFLSVRIMDTGTGIPDHLLKSVFNPFFTTKSVGNGTGLGLSVSQGIIEKHGGHIDVESKIGKGSTFTIHLPIVPIPADIKSGPKEPDNPK